MRQDSLQKKGKLLENKVEEDQGRSGLTRSNSGQERVMLNAKEWNRIKVIADLLKADSTLDHI